MNTRGYYNTLDENFNIAYKLINTHQSHDELIYMLENGNIVEKQLAALKLDNILDSNEAQVLINNLTGQDGKVREAVSAKIAELMKDSNKHIFFNASENYEIFLDAIIDINGNICRNIISTITNLKSDKCFCNLFCTELIERTLKLALTIKDFDFQDGKYKVNKEVFKLYWYLETIYQFASLIDINKLKSILKITKSINEYTIREKTAKILTLNFKDEELQEIKELLKNDTNYYVRRF